MLESTTSKRSELCASAYSNIQQGRCSGLRLDGMVSQCLSIIAENFARLEAIMSSRMAIALQNRDNGFYVHCISML